MNVLQTQEAIALCEALLALQTIDECQMFLTDICTVSEIKAITQRLQVAKYLSHNATYQDICSKTGASTATISRVKRALQFGAGGYERVLERLDTMSTADAVEKNDASAVPTTQMTERDT